MSEGGLGYLGCLCVSAGQLGLRWGLFMLTNIDCVPIACQRQCWALGQFVGAEEQEQAHPADEKPVWFRDQVRGPFPHPSPQP